MEWSEATIENDGFLMVLGQPTIGNDGFSMVGHHWSNDGMVTYHRRSLMMTQMMTMMVKMNKVQRDWCRTSHKLGSSSLSCRDWSVAIFIRIMMIMNKILEFILFHDNLVLASQADDTMHRNF